MASGSRSGESFFERVAMLLAVLVLVVLAIFGYGFWNDATVTQTIVEPASGGTMRTVD